MNLVSKERLSVVLKTVISIVLIVSLVFGMTACNASSSNSNNDLEAILNDTADMLLQRNTKPTYGSVGGEWLVFGMSKWGGELPEGWLDSYYEELELHLKNTNGVLDERKYTEYSRVIIALTAMGKNPMDVAGYNLLLPLGDYEKTTFQGINGAIFALLALDSGNYEVPVNSDAGIQATRDMYIDYILDRELESGGWSLTGDEADVDITAMAIQALAKYQEDSEVKEATDRGLSVLSQCQTENGGFISYGAESCESIAQTIVALTELGIPMDDERFVKKGNTLEDRLLDFMAEDKGFKHILEGDSDPMATEQAFYALVSLNRVNQGMISLYKM